MKHRLLWLSGAAILLLVAIIIWRNSTGNAPEGDDKAKARTSAVTPLKALRGSDPAKLAEPGKAAVSEVKPGEPLASQEVILKKIEDAAVTYDAKALPQIEPYLSHADAEIREAAKNGMINLGDAAAGPLLRKAAKNAPTPQEAVALLEAADYVELPSGRVLLDKDAIKTRRKPAVNVPSPRKPEPKGAASPDSK